MSSPDPGGGEFLERLLGDLLGLMGRSTTGGGSQADLARTLALSVATAGVAEPNVEPVQRIQLEELVRVAELHVSELTGLPVTPSGAPVETLAVTPGTWASHTLDDWRFLLEAMSSASGTGAAPGARGAPVEGPDREGPETRTSEVNPADGAAGDEKARGGEERGVLEGLGLADLGRTADLEGPPSGTAGPADIIARFMSTMGPMLAAMQLGSAIGHLARSTLGQYELPVPRPGARLLFVPQNIERFASDWSLPHDQVRLWVCLREVTAHAVLTRPQVASRVRGLITDVVRGMAEEAAGVVNRLGESELQDPAALQELLGDPETLLGANRSPARVRASRELESVTAALLGYVEHVLDRASSRLLGGRSALAEAWRRRQHERETADRAAELLLGLDLGPAQVEIGSQFVLGVLERAGEEGLSLLWSGDDTLPTPAEIEAPGLWLERLKLTGGGTTSEP